MENRSENEVSEDANSVQPGIANPLNLASLEMGCGQMVILDSDCRWPSFTKSSSLLCECPGTTCGQPSLL